MAVWHVPDSSFPPPGHFSNEDLAPALLVSGSIFSSRHQFSAHHLPWNIWTWSNWSFCHSWVLLPLSLQILMMTTSNVIFKIRLWSPIYIVCHFVTKIYKLRKVSIICFRRKAKLFFISTSSTTSTVSTTTLCYATNANAACGRKKRNIENVRSVFDSSEIAKKAESPVEPSATQW